MKAGLKLWSTNFKNYSEEVTRLFGIDCFSYIELYVVPGTSETIVDWKSLNIPVTIHCPHSAHGFNLSKPELRSHNKHIFDEVRLFADKLKSDYIVIHGGIEGDASETAWQLKNLNDSRALIENKPYKSVPSVIADKTCIGYSFEELDLIKNISGCGFCLDFNHAVCAANSFKQDSIEYIKKLMNLKPDMFHLSDMEDENAEIDTHLHLGQGRLKLTDFAQFLDNNAKVTLETAKNSQTSLEDFISDSVFFYKMKSIE